MIARQRRLFHLLQVAAHRLHKMADREIAAASELTIQQAAVLSVLATGEGDTQRKIAARLGLNESAVTAMIARMMDRGFISRQRNERDGRSWKLKITGKGNTELAATKRPFQRVNTLIEEVLSEDEVKNFADYLERLSSALQERA